MNKAMCVAVAVFGSAWAGMAQSEKVNLVQITDMRGNVAYEVMNREEFAAVTKEIKEEAVVFAAAVAEGKKEWDANKENKFPFQSARIKPRSAKKVGPDYSGREKADKKKEQIEERMNDKQTEELDKEEKKRKNMKDEDVEKADARVKAFEDAFAMISKKMGEKLKRPVPAIGLAFEEPAKEEAKKEEPKKEEKKKEEKKAEKKDEKKEEKK